MLVKISCGYEFPEIMHQSPHSSGQWDDIQFTNADVKQCDYIVVLNTPHNNISTICRKNGKILLVQEPPYERNKFFNYHFRFYDTIFTSFKTSEFKNKIIHSQSALPWHIKKSYDELISLTPDLEKKKNEVSWITSNKAFYSEHKTRLNFLNYLQTTNFKFDLFGNGFVPIDDKFDAIFPYKYTIATENFIDDNYFTEKIVDAFLSWSIPIYYGCSNIDKFFPKEAIIKIDINKPKEALIIIENAINDGYWERNIGAIKESRELVLNKYQFFPMIADLIKKDTRNNKLTKTFIPKSGLTKTEEFKKWFRNNVFKTH